MTIRRTTEQDIAAVMAMYDHSRSLMRADGNTVQWTGYPTVDDLMEDIAGGYSHVVCDDGGVPVGTFALVDGVEPTYGYIDHGRWIDTLTPYSTLHRLAKAPGTSGIADIAFRFAKSHCSHLRIDTHASNRPMRHLAEREGCVECGIVYMGDGTGRVAYEWWRWDQVPADLKDYIETQIIPHYRNFDSAHNVSHARRVIARAMVQAESGTEQPEKMLPTTHYPLPALVFTAAAMHDLGLAFGRERHHLDSGRIIRSNAELRRWFSPEQIEEIAQAAEDHRASATTPPRSMLGCIIAEADRDVEPETIVRRTVEYGLSHYPSLDIEGHWQRTLQHLHEKYAEGGYIKLWLPDSPNAAPLAELRSLIRDEARLRAMFNEIIADRL